MVMLNSSRTTIDGGAVVKTVLTSGFLVWGEALTYNLFWALLGTLRHGRGQWLEKIFPSYNSGAKPLNYLLAKSVILNAGYCGFFDSFWMIMTRDSSNLNDKNDLFHNRLNDSRFSVCVLPLDFVKCSCSFTNKPNRNVVLCLLFVFLVLFFYKLLNLDYEMYPSTSHDWSKPRYLQFPTVQNLSRIRNTWQIRWHRRSSETSPVQYPTLQRPLHRTMTTSSIGL